MKQGLLLKEAPEPIASFYCFGDGCGAVFYDQHEYRKHRLDAHDEVFEYIYEKEHSSYLKYLKKTVTYPGCFVKR